MGKRAAKWRAAIVGCGKIAGGYDRPGRDKHLVRTHVRAYRSEPRFSLVACCDRKYAKARAFARDWNISWAFDDLGAMVRAERPNVVSVCVSTRAHETILARLTQLPIQLVFAEKPFTANVAAARGLLAAFRKKRIAVAVNYLRRWCPNHRTVADWIQSGKLGRVVQMEGRYSGGLWNMGSHLVDLMLWFGGAPRRILRGPHRPIRDDVRAAGEIEFRDGARGLLRPVHGEAFDLLILLERGFIEIRRFGYEGRAVRLAAGRAKTVFKFAPPARGIDSALARAAENLADHLESGEELLCSGDDALETLKVCEALAQTRR
ncbi:MAG: Gfo/Idh/MocA family oxidoreductase [Verrucomicrobiae bacterium]|nr:Gfo/Idh/MocA family oxidoreductase [Verrucomicrobiae bacterium]